MQTTDYSCTSASLASIARNYDINASEKSIAKLTGLTQWGATSGQLRYAMNKLNIGYNKIYDISAVSEMTNLVNLQFIDNQISDLGGFINSDSVDSKDRLDLRSNPLSDYAIEAPELAITKVEQEQARLLDITSKSFDGLRDEKDIMHIKAFHDSFKVLSEIIENAINDIMSNASLSTASYERINTLPVKIKN